MASIDGMATVLTGQRDYFSLLGSGATDGERRVQAEREAAERGQKPWPR
jgi:hypothetical protein